MDYLVPILIFITLMILLYPFLINYFDRLKLNAKIKTFLKIELKKDQSLVRNFDKEKPYDLIFKRGQTTCLIKVYPIPSFAEVIVNAKTTWELRYGAGNTPGKAQPMKKYLPRIAGFANLAVDDDMIKIVLFTPDPKKKVRYINENEMDFVLPKTDVYGMKILSESEFIAFLQE